MGLLDDEIEYEESSPNSTEQSFEVIDTSEPLETPEEDPEDLPFLDLIDQMEGVGESLPSLNSSAGIRQKSLREINEEVKDFTEDIAVRRMEEEDNGAYRVTDFVYDVREVRLMGQYAASTQDMAGFFNVSEATIQRLLADAESDFAKVYNKALSIFTLSLRQGQAKAALGGSEKMLIHLGKHVLGQVDSTTPQASSSKGSDPNARRKTIRRLTQTIEEFEE